MDTKTGNSETGHSERRDSKLEAVRQGSMRQERGRQDVVRSEAVRQEAARQEICDVGAASEERWQMGLYDWTSVQSSTLKCYRQARRRLQLAVLQQPGGNVPFGPFRTTHGVYGDLSREEQETTS